MKLSEAVGFLRRRLLLDQQYRYRALHSDGVPEDRTRDDVWAARYRPVLKASALAAGLLVLLYLVVAISKVLSHRGGTGREPCETPELGFQCWPSLSHYWGQYSPFFSVDSEIDNALPSGCSYTFAQMLSRHGARDPTASKTAEYNAVVSRIHATVEEYGKGYEFIRDYEYTLGADQLSLFGQQQMINSGIKFYERYQALARTVSPFVRSSGQKRVVDSAVNWTLGFHQSRVADDLSAGPDDFPYSMVVIEETDGVNNTMSHGLCPSFEHGVYSGVGREAEATFMRVFAPAITGRLNSNLPGANLSDGETIYMMDLCPFNTVAGKGDTLSPFCALFTEAEWRQYDYYQSLGKWYGMGGGNPLGPTQGVGWANELIARLTGKPVQDHTSTNSTLDGSPKTFPLDRSLYADFSHDNDMTSIFAALGLFDAIPPLSNTTPQTPAQSGGYAASWTVPFAGRTYVEKMRCIGGTDRENEEEELVRVLINDRVIPLQNCDADALGRCRLSDFVESLAFARSGGKWDLCFT